MVILSLFVLSQGVLALVIWLGHRFARRETRVKARFETIACITHRPSRLEAACREQAATKVEMRVLDERLARGRRQLEAMIPSDLAPSAGGFILLAAIWYEAESAVALALNLASGFGGAPDAVLAFLSPLVAAALFAVLHVLLRAVIRVGAGDKPGRVLNRAKVGAVVTGFAVILAAWLVLSGRSLSDPNLVETLASWGITLLALLLSVAGAFALLVVTTLADERAPERRVARLEAEKTALEQHVKDLEDDIQRNTPRPSSAAHLTAVGGAVLTVVLAAWPAPGASAQTVANPPSTAVMAVAGWAPTVTEGACEALFDVSTSLEMAARQEAVGRLSSDLDVLIDVYGCRLLRFSAFSGEPPFNVLRETPLPAASASGSCANVQSVGKASTTSKVVQSWFPHVKDAHQNRDRETCETAQQQQRDAAVRDRRQALDAARVVLREVAATPPRGTCTALDFAVQRALRRSQHVLALTDGANTCAVAGAGSSTRVQSSQSLTFLLLPSSGARAPDRGLRAVVRLEQAYPASRVLFFAELTPSQWQTLKPENARRPVAPDVTPAGASKTTPQ